MDNLKLKQNNYKGKIIKMPKHSNEKTSDSNDSMYTIPQSTLKLAGWIVGILIGVLGWLCVQLYELNATTKANSNSIANLEERMNTAYEYMLNLDNEISQINPNEDIIISASKELSSSLNSLSVQANVVPNVTSSLSSDICIGTDSSGKEYFADELVNKTILLTYEEENKNVFFLGQYNENYHWNGYCVTNAYYPDDSLYGICESNFEDGKRIDYKTLVSAKENEWDYYNRISIENINSGTSIKYSFQYNTIKNFTSTNVRASDILYVDNFIEKQDAVMLQYYHGNTSDGKYNDNSGSAYLVKFYEDGTVKTLYVGNFANGTFNDNTNNAWNIVYAEKLGYYVYHSGIFKNGSAIDNSIEPITQQQINEKISGYDFDCPLKWKDTPDSKFMR